MKGSPGDSRTIDTIAAELIRVVPELRMRYEQELRWWRPEMPAAHVVFGDLLVPYIRELCEAGDDAHVLPRIFEFLETLATAQREGVREVVAVSVIEPLFSDENDRIRETYRQLGPATRAFVDSLR